MKLFDDLQRDDDRGKPYAEGFFEYYNRSAREDVGRIRAVLESWFDRYPANEKDRLHAAFRNDFDSAFFELLLHELFTRLGHLVSVHPDAGPGVETHPDFLVETPQGSRFFVEARVARGESDQERNERRVSDVFKDEINKLESKNFFLHLRLKRVPRQAPSGERFRLFLQRELEKLDPVRIAEAHEAQGYSGLPQIIYKPTPDLVAVVRPIPVKREARGVPRERPIGVVSGGGVHPVPSAAEPIRRAIQRKRGRYGDLAAPYVVAVNAMAERAPRPSQVVEALLGDEQIESVLSEDGRIANRFVRAPNAVFGTAGSARDTRLSAVLIAAPVTVWNLTNASMCVYRNPSAARPLAGELDGLPTARFDAGEPIWTDGSVLGDLLGLSAGWPHS